MANITPTPEWSGVYQLETTDDVLAGPDGLANAQAQHLANRTELLKRAKDATIPTYSSPEAGVDPVTGVGNGAYYNVRSTDDDTMLVEYQNVDGVPTPSGKSYPSSEYVQFVEEFTALPFVPGESYGIGKRVQLTNGDIVRSVIANNTNNPNLNMTGWVRPDDFGLQFDSGLNSIRVVKLDSVAALKAWPFLFSGMKAKTESYYSGMSKGGAYYRWDATSNAVENGMTIISSNTTATGRWLLQGRLNTHSAGCYAEGATDDTAKLNAIALLGLGYQVRVKRGVYMVNAVANGFKLKSGNYFYCEDDVVFKVIPNAANSYSAVTTEADVVGAKLLGKFTILGDRTSHTGTTGEWGMGISVKSSVDVEFGDVLIRDTWGDGVYIGSTTTTAPAPVDTKFGRLKIDNCRRQGLSVITCDGLDFDYLEASNINGISPECGVDFEPNAGGQSIKRVRIKELVTRNCAWHGLVLGLGKIDGGFVDIRIDKFTSDRDYMGIYGLAHPISAQGQINFGEVNINESKVGSVMFTSWDASGVKVLIDSLLIKNPNTTNGLSTSTGGLPFSIRTISAYGKPIGGISVGSFKVLRDDSVVTYQNTHDMYLNIEHQNSPLVDCSLPIENLGRAYGAVAAMDVTKNTIKNHNRFLSGVVTESANLAIIGSSYLWVRIKQGIARNVSVYNPAIFAVKNTLEYSVDDLYDSRSAPATGPITVTFAAQTNEGFTTYTLGAVDRKLGDHLRFKVVEGVWVVESKKGNWVAV